MKRVLVTGAAGVIGIQTIKYLLSEGKYEITALDLRNKSNYKKLKKYRRRINIIYGDINDKILIEALV
ncbi:NAD-dependent epimerase/dehydratase family protein, partial [uncultured Brachyspira sp.]|uniref:NAD-dependent epimerase/dehydratase family protein n=1 Tax=uncultured Brachyspira sp. TaxID=221953 RepID=UPI0025D67AE7